MQDTELIEIIRRKAADPATRTDMARVPPRPLPSPASAEAITSTERILGHALHPLHRRLLREIGNGGFGPGGGLFGVPGGHMDDDGRSMLELRDRLGNDEEHPQLPRGVLPLCDIGCGTWMCIDSLAEDGCVLVVDEHGLTDSGMSFRSWIEDWAAGVDLQKKMFTEGEERQVINPFTRSKMIVRGAGRAKGRPYVER
jgi:hypothetical protein